MRAGSLLALTFIVLVFALTPAFVHAARAGSSPISFSNETPGPNATTSSTTPTISVSYSDAVSTINTGEVYIFVDGINVTSFQGVTVTESKLTYVPPTITSLKNGPHNVSVSVTDNSGNTATANWNFTVNTNATGLANPLAGIKPLLIVEYIGITALIVGAGFGGYILYLKQTTRFTFRKYFATHSIERQIYILYIPVAIAFLFVILGLAFVYSNPSWPASSVDYVFIIAIFIALTAFGIDARREMLQIRAYERAFAQFLFELADAMRGGLDPAKSIVELSKTHSNILAKQLRIAADGIRLGRPLDKVLIDMVEPMHSHLIQRYAGLIAEATTAGGETAVVVYRAAKDMDDFVKIEEEREKQLMLPVAVIYIAFAVLMAVLFALLYIAPSIGTLNVSFIGLNGLPSSANAAQSQVPKLSFGTLKERFFELMIINALGTGAIIGAFTEGRARYGILHSLALVAATAIAFAIIFP
jgi:pilus assembly protein TadC